MTKSPMSAMPATGGPRIDLTDTDLFVDGDPFAAWAWLRRNAPVYWNADQAGGGFWALTRYADIAAVYLDATTFTSERGTVMGGSFRSAEDSASGQMIICSDPPAHRLLRQQVHQGFTPSIVSRIGEQARRYVDRAMTNLVDAGGGDLAVEVALELPAAMLAVMFGLDRQDAQHLLDLTHEMIGHRDDEYLVREDQQRTLISAQVKIFDFFIDLVASRRRKSVDDLPSRLLAAQLSGRPMSEQEILYNCLNVAVGGNETTPYAACGGVHALVENPDQADLLYGDPDVLPTAVDEILRWTSANAYVGRTATRDVEINGTRIGSGDMITLWNASANRDESEFTEPDRFLVTRAPNHHLAFGVGVHRCIGQAVAREELSVFFRYLAERGIRLRLDGPVERLRSNFMLGIKHLPVAVVSAGGSDG